MPRRNLYSRVPSVSSRAVLGHRDACSDRRARRGGCWRGRPRWTRPPRPPRRATCAGGDGGPELLNDGLVRGVVRRGAWGGDARLGARRARGGRVELFASSHLFVEGGRDPGEPAVAEGSAVARGMHGDARCAAGGESGGAVRGGATDARGYLWPFDEALPVSLAAVLSAETKTCAETQDCQDAGLHVLARSSFRFIHSLGARTAAMCTVARASACLAALVTPRTSPLRARRGRTPPRGHDRPVVTRFQKEPHGKWWDAVPTDATASDLAPILDDLSCRRALTAALELSVEMCFQAYDDGGQGRVPRAVAHDQARGEPALDGVAIGPRASRGVHPRGDVA